MAKKYTYSRQIATGAGLETFSAVEFDSFDEAIVAVDKGIKDRQLQVPARVPGIGLVAGFPSTGAPLVPPPAPPVPHNSGNGHPTGNPSASV